MRKTKLLTSIAALALVLGLGACEVTEEETPDEGGESEVGVVFGFTLDGKLNAIDGKTVTTEEGKSYSYEGTYTANLDEAVRVSYEAGSETGEYYLSFELEDTTYWITITEGSYTNLSYATEKAPLYWNPTYECWGNQKQTYFLCQNATYQCLYCSAISQYIESSPIAGLYNVDGSKVTGFVGDVYEAVPGYTIAGDPEDLENATLLGTFDLSESDTEASTTVLTPETALAALSSSWTTDGSETTSPLASVSNIDRAYKGAGGTETSNSGLQLSSDCIKFGNNSNGGEFTLNFAGISVDHVVVVATSWNSGNEATLVANGLGRVVGQSAKDLNDVSDVSTYQYDFESGTSELTLSTVESGKRALIFSIALYTDEAA